MLKRKLETNDNSVLLILTNTNIKESLPEEFYLIGFENYLPIHKRPQPRWTSELDEDDISFSYLDPGLEKYAKCTEEVDVKSKCSHLVDLRWSPGYVTYTVNGKEHCYGIGISKSPTIDLPKIMSKYKNDSSLRELPRKGITSYLPWRVLEVEQDEITLAHLPRWVLGVDFKMLGRKNLVQSKFLYQKIS